MRSLVVLGVLSFVTAGCGGSAPPAATPSPAGDATSAAAPSPSPSTPSPSPSASTASDDPPLDDPNESATPITMAPLLTKSTPRSTYPKPTAGDKECWQTVRLSGKTDADFAAIIAGCGAPTGLAEYAKPVTGKLHSVHDRRDTYTLKLMGGMCYRYFGVADAGINDLDILVEKPNGALVADDKQSSPVAIVDADKTWCMDEDAEYQFLIQVHGTGKGGYTFGVWAKPKK